MEDWTDLQRQFVKYYVGECNLNGTRAAIKAGYSRKSARQIASENLSKPYIRAEIDRLLEAQAMSKSEVLARLTLHGRGDMREFINLSSKQLKRHPDGQLIKKYKRTVTTYGDDRTEEKVELELYDAQAALVQLGKYHKLFSERIEVDDWRSQAIRDIKAGLIEFEALADEFDRDTAAELFTLAGEIIPTGAGEAADGSAADGE